MEYAYVYDSPDRLYLNVTNRCTNRCVFCVRHHCEGLGGACLQGGFEPDLGDLLEAVERAEERGRFSEFVWCGFGEPTFRLDLITGAAPRLRSRGARIRLNTNGHGSLIHGRDVLDELAASVDVLSVSLNAADAVRYAALCRPDLAAAPAVRYWEAVLDCVERAASKMREVRASVVGHVLSAEEIEACRSLALSLGVAGFRVR
jgi:TatD DNase family protein